MIENLPLFISILFIITTFLSVFLFYKASGNNNIVLLVLLVWLGVQSVLAMKGFYTVTDSMPPRFLLLAGPPLLLLLFLFLTHRGRRFIDRFDLKLMTWMHVVRIPVEITLFLLFREKLVPELMTFEGRNFDIISGITAPLMVLFAFTGRSPKRGLLLAWNFICLLLVFNIVIHAVLAAPSPFQQLAFDQPNVAIFYFPFVWLPCCVVPIVFFSHFASIRKLLRR